MSPLDFPRRSLIHQCDESLPECSQCLQIGRKCPGALVGAVIIDMSTRLMGKVRTTAENNPVGTSDRDDVLARPLARATQDQPAKQPAKQEHIPRKTISQIDGSKRPKLKPFCDRVDPGNTSATLRPSLASNEDPFPTRDFQIPRYYQPSRVEPFQQHFFSLFIDYFSHPDPGCSWVRDLPSVLNSTSSFTLKCSIRAAVMGLYGVLARDQSIQTESCRWYARALETQRRRVSELSNNVALDGSMVFISIMFAIFETAMSTVAGAWTRHACAAVKLIEMIGPESCQKGYLHHLFRTIRQTDVSVLVSIIRLC